MTNKKLSKQAVNDGRSLSLTAEQNIPADGKSYSKIQATQSQIISNEVIIFSCVGSALFDNGEKMIATKANVLGIASANLSNTVAESVTVSVIQPSDPASLVSIVVTFGTDTATLPPPVLREASNGNINVNDVTVGQVSVDIAPWAAMKAGDAVAFSWSGRLANGALGPEGIFARDITSSEVGRTVTFPVSVANYLRPYAGGGELRLLYSLNNVLSETARITVDNNGGGTLEAPSVDEAQNDVLVPEQQGIVTYRVPAWPGMAAGDLLTRYWRGIPAAGNPVIFADELHISALNVGRPVLQSIDAQQAVVPFNNGQVELWYRVQPAAGGPVQSSVHQNYRVGNSSSALPAPDIEEAVNGELEPNSILEGANVLIPATANLQKDDVVTLYINDSIGSVLWTDSHEVTVKDVDKEFWFIVPGEVFDDNQEHIINVNYSIKRKSGETIMSPSSQFLVTGKKFVSYVIVSTLTAKELSESSAKYVASGYIPVGGVDISININNSRDITYAQAFGLPLHAGTVVSGDYVCIDGPYGLVAEETSRHLARGYILAGGVSTHYNGGSSSNKDLFSAQGLYYIQR